MWGQTFRICRLRILKKKTSLTEEYFKQGFKYSDLFLFFCYLSMVFVTMSAEKNLDGIEPETSWCTFGKRCSCKWHESGQTIGYRTIWRRLKVNHMNVNHKDVMDLMKIIDPNGVELRKAHRI